MRLRYVVYGAAFGAFNEAACSKRIPNLPLTTATNENSELRVTALCTITIVANEGMSVCRHHL